MLVYQSVPENIYDLDLPPHLDKVIETQQDR